MASLKASVLVTGRCQEWSSVKGNEDAKRALYEAVVLPGKPPSPRSDPPNPVKHAKTRVVTTQC